MVAGNWKMNTTVAEGLALAQAVLDRSGGEYDVDIAVLPPFTHLWPIAELLRDSWLQVGAQDVFWVDAGAFTGEVSPAMLAGWCQLALVGHSERRHLLGETDEQTGAKFHAAHRNGLSVIVAVGETESERDGGATMAVVERQLDAALAPFDVVPPADTWVVAYEPVWAIGTGRTATAAQAQEVCAHIRAHVAHRSGAEAPRVLYGGSVTPATAAELFAEPDIDGGLIGGASMHPEQFLAIVEAAAASLR